MGVVTRLLLPRPAVAVRLELVESDDFLLEDAEVDMVPNGWMNFAGTGEEMDALIALPELAEGEWRHVLTERKAGRVSYY